MQHRAALPCILVLMLASFGAAAEETVFDIGGRLRAQVVGATYPEDSVFRQFTGSNTKDLNTGARVVFTVDRGPWDFRADYQLASLWGDSVEAGRALPPGLGTIAAGRVPTDERRLFDLTDVITENNDFVLLQRLDRLSVGHKTEKTVLRFGRQALSWGNGLIYAPMDFVNPFDPAQVDREYKAGDDLLYGQYLTDSGDDLQGVVVFRRNLATGDVDDDASAVALKYHGFRGAGEYDLLFARNYGDTLAGFGGNISVGGGVWRGDLVVTSTDTDVVPQVVVSYSESWVWFGKNVSGVAEYFHNGFGQSSNNYSPEALADNTDLVERLLRGELFTLGKNYLALSALIEITPLFLFTPNLFMNVGDPSALFQVVTQNDLRENLTLLGSLNIPFGSDGSEFGGPDSGVPGLYLSTGPSVSLQLNWYF